MDIEPPTREQSFSLQGPVTTASPSWTIILISTRSPKSEIDAGFDGESGAREQVPVVAGFVVVHVHAIAVNRFAEAVAGTVEI